MCYSFSVLCHIEHTFFTFAEEILKTTLSLYMELSDDCELPLPTHEEVLICSEQTTAEEVILLWRRAFGDPDNNRIFCLVHAELLLYQACDKSLYQFQQLSLKAKKGDSSIACWQF